MKKILGLICAWGVEDWISPCLKQAEKFCDEVFLCVSSHSRNLDIFKDKTLEIAKEFKSVNIIYNSKKNFHSNIKAEIFNKMLKQSKNYKIGNWIWILDADEFYFDETYKKIKDILYEDRYEKIEFEAKFFIYDMISYIKSRHGRLYKIKPINLLPFKYFRFRPTQQWSPRFSNNIKTYKLDGDHEMFHYSMLTNPDMRLKQWESEYNDDIQKRFNRLKHVLKIDVELECKLLADQTILIKRI